jgi:hypothetical protein
MARSIVKTVMSRRIMGTHDDYTIQQGSRADIPAVHALSCEIFNGQETPSHHPSLEEWFTSFDDYNGFILVAMSTCSTSTDDTNATDVDMRPSPEKFCSYIFAYERKSALTDEICMHVWLCATCVPHRSKGITR